MNENINLIEILKDCPKGTKFYSPLFGEAKFSKVDEEDDYPIKLERDYSFTAEGYYLAIGTECLLFPSNEQRDWEIWKEEQKKKYQYQVGDYITLSKNQLSAYFSKVINSDFGVFKIIEKTETQFITHWIETDIIEPLNIGIAFLDTIPYCKIDKYPISNFQPFDRVLVRGSNFMNWKATHFSHYEDMTHDFVDHCGWKQCIPFNTETKHLVGTCLACTEFYKNW